ncbi:hypothetical protein F5Y18DRAFT_249912 [Xylariaceae sp. FL1019]|nr:hypothetical protein F5Y18DRAFT_249912 [Xylariaceae sp. FL1019]
MLLSVSIICPLATGRCTTVYVSRKTKQCHSNPAAYYSPPTMPGRYLSQPTHIPTYAGSEDYAPLTEYYYYEDHSKLGSVARSPGLLQCYIFYHRLRLSFPIFPFHPASATTITAASIAASLTYSQHK